MQDSRLPLPLRAYIAAHLIALVPVLGAAATRVASAPDPLLFGTLLLVSSVAGIFRIPLTVVRGHLSLGFPCVCLALLLLGTPAAVFCAAAAAWSAFLCRLTPEGGRWRFRRLRHEALHRRVFNVAHCALVCALAGWGRDLLLPALPAGWIGEMAGLAFFATLYFFLNSLGVATAIGLDQGTSPLRIWREHYFWTAPAHYAGALAAAAIWTGVHFFGTPALLLLGTLAVVFLGARAYIDVLRNERALAKEIERLYREAEEASRRKDEFLAMLAHELRNPLGAILNAHYLLERSAGRSDPEAARRSIDVIGRQSHQLRRLVDDLLDVSRITRGKIELRPEPVDLRQFLEDALDAVRPLVEERGHRVTVELDPEPVAARADAVRIEQVFGNLLSNAAKYTEPGGRIHVTLRAEGADAVLRVRDTGVGIDPELLPRIFDLFVQGERSLARSQGGLGIGLTLVRSLVELHGGRVEAHSDGPGQGSEFVVRLPRLPAEALPQPSRPPQGARLRRPAAEPAEAPDDRPTVVLVEDNEDAAESLAEVLEVWGYRTRTARDGLSGLDLIRRGRPAVALVDLGLPGIDGYELARRLRADAAAPGEAPLLVALTGYGRAEDRAATRAAGFDHHLVKPVDPEELRRLLEAHLGPAPAPPPEGRPAAGAAP